MALEQARHHFIADFVVFKHHCQKQAFAADVFQDMRIFVAQHADFLQQIIAFFGGLLRQVFFQHHPNAGQCGGTSQRVAAGGGGVHKGVWLEARPNFSAREKARHRHHAAAQRFAEADDIGRHAPMIHTENFAGAAKAGLHFVGNQKHAVAAADFAQARPIIIGRHNGAGLALYRLHHHRGHIHAAHRIGNAQKLLHRVGIAIRHMAHAAEQRQKRLAVNKFAQKRERAQRFAVKAAGGGNKAAPTGVELGELHRAVYRFGAAVGKKAVLQFTRSELGNHFGQLAAQGVEHFLAVLRAAVELCFHRFNDFRVADAGAVEAEAAEHVDVFAPHNVAQNRALAIPIGEGEIGGFSNGFAIIEKAAVNVVGKIIRHVGRHPAALCVAQFVFRRVDDVEHLRSFIQSGVDISISGMCVRRGGRHKFSWHAVGFGSRKIFYQSKWVKQGLSGC